MRSFHTLFLSFALLATSACGAAASPTPTATLEPSATPTATRDWFPATGTPTSRPQPSAMPTLDMRPGMGDVLLEEDFSDDDLWDTTADDDALVVVDDNQIHLTQRDTRSYLITTRSEGTYTDFYAEVTVNTNLCRGDDEYGLVVRALNATNHFRFALSCDGRAKVDRLYQNSYSNVVAWQQHGSVPSLAPAEVRLGVWANGSEVRFFVDGVYLFSVTDSLLYLGGVGVFVRSGGEGDVSVSFSELTVWAVEDQ
jgi:hypothetical protein